MLYVVGADDNIASTGNGLSQHQQQSGLKFQKPSVLSPVTQTQVSPVPGTVQIQGLQF